MRSVQIQALTLDLDDTLWPVRPVIARAERLQREWLECNAPATAAAFDAAGLLRLRAEVEQQHPHLSHDLGTLRRTTLRRAVRAAGEPEALGDQAFEVFFEARQQVEFYPDALEALQRLARRFPLLSVSNGNADLQRVGIDQHFVGAVSAVDVGVAKPDRRVFETACRRLGRLPSQVLHVGDDVQMDVLGAAAAGLAAAWLRRPGSASDLAARAADSGGDRRHAAPPSHIPVLADLNELARQLGC